MQHTGGLTGAAERQAVVFMSCFRAEPTLADLFSDPIHLRPDGGGSSRLLRPSRAGAENPAFRFDARPQPGLSAIFKASTGLSLTGASAGRWMA